MVRNPITSLTGLYSKMSAHRHSLAVVVFIIVLFGCGEGSPDNGFARNSSSQRNSEIITQPADTELEKLGEDKVKALTTRALEWMNEHPGKHEPQLCLIAFRIVRGVNPPKYLEPLFTFVDKNDSKLAVRLWMKSNGEAGVAGPAAVVSARELANTHKLLSPMQVLEIIGQKYPDTEFFFIECSNVPEVSGVFWQLVTFDEEQNEYLLDAYTGKWKD